MGNIACVVITNQGGESCLWLQCHLVNIGRLANISSNMYLVSSSPQPSQQQRHREIKRIGVQYWQRLCLVGIPSSDARAVAAAIAKFDLAQRLPNLEQKQLIIRYSAAICRAQLWRRNLLGA